MSTPVPSMAETLLIILRNEANADVEQRGQRVFGWKVAHYSLGVIPSVAAIFTGAAVLTDVGVPVDIAGIVVVILGAVSLAITFYDFRGRMVNNFIARAAWGRLRDQAAAAIVDNTLDEAEKLAAFDHLSARQEQIRVDEAKGRVEKKP